MSAGGPWKLLFAALLAAAFALAGTALANGPRDEQVRDIARLLNCPVCSGQSVADSSAPLAQQMRDLIDKKLAQGESREEILQYFVDRYGEAVLREPIPQGFNQFLWLLPPLGLVGGAAALVLTIRRRKTGHLPPAPSERPTPAGPPRKPQVSEEDVARYEKQVEEDLKRL